MSSNTHPNSEIFWVNGMPSVRSWRIGSRAGRTYCSVIRIIKPIDPNVAAAFSWIYDIRILLSACLEGKYLSVRGYSNSYTIVGHNMKSKKLVYVKLLGYLIC